MYLRVRYYSHKMPKHENILDKNKKDKMKNNLCGCIK